MFKILKKTSFVWPVKVRLPTDGGRFEESTFDVTFRRLDKDEVEAIRQEVLVKEGDAAEAARKVVIGWAGVEDDAGPIPFSDTAFSDLLSIHRVAPSIMAAFFESCYAAERKN
jgi:hypothetical protein